MCMNIQKVLSAVTLGVFSLSLSQLHPSITKYSEDVVEPPSTVLACLMPLPVVTLAVAIVIEAEPTQVPVKVIPGVERYRALIAQYNWPVDTALAIMQAESGGNPNAVSPTNDYGLMQIHDGLQTYGPQIFDPAFNIAIAYNVKYRSRGFRPWSVYTSGKYLSYL